MEQHKFFIKLSRLKQRYLWGKTEIKQIAITSSQWREIMMAEEGEEEEVHSLNPAMHPMLQQQTLLVSTT